MNYLHEYVHIARDIELHFTNSDDSPLVLSSSLCSVMSVTPIDTFILLDYELPCMSGIMTFKIVVVYIHARMFFPYAFISNSSANTR